MGTPEIKVQLDITPEAVNAAVVNAIVNSSVGEKLHEAIEQVVKNLGQRAYWDSPLQKIVEQHINTTIQARVAEMVKPELTARVAAALTPERLAPLVQQAADFAVEKISRAIAGW